MDERATGIVSHSELMVEFAAIRREFAKLDLRYSDVDQRLERIENMVTAAGGAWTFLRVAVVVIGGLSALLVWAKDHVRL